MDEETGKKGKEGKHKSKISSSAVCELHHDDDEDATTITLGVSVARLSASV